MRMSWNDFKSIVDEKLHGLNPMLSWIDVAGYERVEIKMKLLNRDGKVLKKPEMEIVSL